MRTWFSGRTTAFQAVDRGSIPRVRTIIEKRPTRGRFSMIEGELASQQFGLRGESKVGACPDAYRDARRGREYSAKREGATDELSNS